MEILLKALAMQLHGKTTDFHNTSISIKEMGGGGLIYSQLILVITTLAPIFEEHAFLLCRILVSLKEEK